jgi:hypothetical protein
MVKITGLELDKERSSDGTNGSMWTLVFTEGLFEGPGVSKFLEPVQFKLKRKDYQYSIPKGFYIYYNPYNNQWQIIENDKKDECDDVGYNVGGFIVRSCNDIVFLYPRCTDDVQYVRPFTEEFTEGYEKRLITCDDYDDLCGAFREENFSNDFEIDCPIIETGNEFNDAEFDTGEFT